MASTSCDEHFDIAVAEMIRGGCIAFVTGAGGPAEIVGQHTALVFATPAEAAAKIVAVLTDESLRAALRVHLAGRARLHSCDAFAGQLRDIAHRFPAAAA